MMYTIRKMKETEYPLLEHFLYEAIYIPQGSEAPPRSITKNPELQVYIAGFGKGSADHALIAEVNGEVVGAVWVRIMNDYGHIDEDTPSFAISIDQQYRGFGIGTALMKAMLSLLQADGYKQASLSVQKENYAAKMYQKIGFQIVDENEDEYLMKKNIYRSLERNFDHA